MLKAPRRNSLSPDLQQKKRPHVAEAGTRTPPKLSDADSVHNNPLAYEHEAHHNQSYAEAAQHQPAHGSSQAPEPTHDPLTKLEVSKGINIAMHCRRNT